MAPSDSMIEAVPLAMTPISLARLVRDVGLPSLLVIYLVWMGANILPKLETDMLVMRDELSRTREMLQEHLRMNQQLLQTVEQLCANTAHDATERSGCFPTAK